MARPVLRIEVTRKDKKELRRLLSGGVQQVRTYSYAYDAFGNVIAQTGSTVNGFLYRGEQFDSTLGLYYLRARYYRPLLGRFLTADTSETSFAADQWIEIPLHRFSHGNADPIGRLDRSGHAAETAVAYKNTGAKLLHLQSREHPR